MGAIKSKYGVLGGGVCGDGVRVFCVGVLGDAREGNVKVGVSGFSCEVNVGEVIYISSRGWEKGGWGGKVLDRGLC